MNTLRPTLIRNACLAIAMSSLIALPACADCKYQEERSSSTDTDGISRVEIEARAGSLTVKGSSKATTIEANGTACASSRDALEDVQIRTQRKGDTLHIVADIPKSTNWKDGGSLDLDIELPTDIVVSVQDGSGSTRLEGITLDRITDGSGDLRLRDTRGDLRINDGSGSLRITDHDGAVEITDGSGDVDINDITGGVRIASDGSGGLEMKNVGGSVKVDSDGSGDINVSSVRGDFKVDRAGSGDVRHRGVEGRVSVPDRR